MEEYTAVLANLLSLNPIEELCKQFLAKYPDKHMTETQELRAFLQNAAGLDDIGSAVSALTENSRIPAGYNVKAVKHIRYLPEDFHSHDFFEINCVLSGSCTYRTVDKSVQIQTGNIVVFPPHTSHLIDVRSDDCILIDILIRASTFDHYFFSMFRNYDVLADFWRQILYGKRERDYLLFHCGDEPEIRNCALDIFQAANSPHRYQNQMLDALFHVFLVTLMQNHEENLVLADPVRQKDDSSILPIINYIGREYRTLTLSKLAEEFHYSERQMMRLLKEHTGRNFSEIIREIKLKKAVVLLENSDLSFQSIVETVGYSDMSHFYRVFRKGYGCTPAEYRAGKMS